VSASGPALNIAMLSASYAPEPTGIGPYSADLAEALASRGHAVRVVAAFPFYPAWRAQVPRGTLLHRTERRGDVRVTRCRVYVPRNPRPTRRVLHEVSWIFGALGPVARLVAWADVWLVVSPSFGSAVLGAFLARVFRARVHLHVQDVVPDIALESGQLGTGLGVSLARSVARWTYRSFRSFSVLSESMAARLRAHMNGAVARQLIAPNWVRRSAVTVPHLPERLAGRPYALYAGSFGRKQDLTLLTEAARLLAARQGPAIVVLGDGPGRDVLTQAGAGVIWLGLVDDATYASVLENALAGIVALAPGVGDSVVPSKLAGYLGAGRPVVVAANVESEAARVVTRCGCGFVVAPGRADELANSLWQLAHDQATWHAFATAGKAYAHANWEKDAIVRRIEGALVKTAQGID
jgi:colanic acid biosynthesis glycosyl transferase WcaI